MATRPTRAQKVALLDFLEKNPCLARGRLPNADARRKAQDLWSEIARDLNAMGGIIKDKNVWKKYWNDRKTAVKKSASKRMQAMRRTGGGVEDVPELSSLDEKVLSILGHDFGSGISGVAVPPFSGPIDVELLTEPDETVPYEMEIDNTEISPDLYETEGTCSEAPLSPPFAFRSETAPTPNPSQAEGTCEAPLGPTSAPRSETDPTPMQRPSTSSNQGPPRRRPRYHGTLHDVCNKLVDSEQHRLDRINRLTEAQLKTAESQQATALAQQRTAESQQRAAEALTKAAKEHAEVALVLANAARSLLETAQAMGDMYRHIGSDSHN